MPWSWFKPSSKIFYWPFHGGTSFVDLLLVFSVLCMLCLCVRLFVCALWSPAGKGLTSWLSLDCELFTFPLVSWVRCGSWFYRFLIFAPLLTLNIYKARVSQNPNEYKHIKVESDNPTLDDVPWIWTIFKICMLSSCMLLIRKLNLRC